MDYEKFFVDFEKRYGEKCRYACFCGKPITFFSRTALTAGCALSVGGALALSRRGDDRFIAESSETLDYISCNRLDFPFRTDTAPIRILSEAEKYGVNIGGAQILTHRNTDLSYPLVPLLLTALKGFCKNVPPVSELIKHFDGYEQNMLCISSRADRMTVFDGQKCIYLPFEDAKIKIVLCRIGENVKITSHPTDNTANEALDMLRKRNFEKFGELLNRETARLLDNNKNRKTKQLFDTAVRLSDAYGSGILEDGGIFSVVKNSSVDTFMHNLGAEYSKHFGAAPDFYVTKAADSTREFFLSENG